MGVAVDLQERAATKRVVVTVERSCPYPPRILEHSVDEVQGIELCGRYYFTGAVANEVEVLAKATRPRFSSEYKLRILREAEAFTATGAIGALLRREGLHSSYLTTCRAQQGRGELLDMTPRKRGPRVLAVFNDERFANLAPAEVYATLLDEERYICSIRTMYRILQAHGELKERRRQRRSGPTSTPT